MKALRRRTDSAAIAAWGTRRRILAASAGAVALCLATIGAGPATAAPNPNAASDIPGKDRQFIEYAQANPDDYAGIDALSQKLFGSRYYVQIEGMSEEVTGEQAAKLARDASSTIGPMASLPVDTFTISIGRSTVSSGIYVTGSVVFRSTYAGQAAPHDVASLQISAPACITLNNHTINTYNQAGSSTALGYLYNANVTKKAPVWKINDYTSGFSNQAHRSSAYVLLKKSGCSGAQSISAAYRYEHNQGGALGSISAGFGFLTIGYSGSVFNIQKSSGVTNFTW